MSCLFFFFFCNSSSFFFQTEEIEKFVQFIDRYFLINYEIICEKYQFVRINETKSKQDGKANENYKKSFAIFRWTPI